MGFGNIEGITSTLSLIYGEEVTLSDATDKVFIFKLNRSRLSVLVSNSGKVLGKFSYIRSVLNKPTNEVYYFVRDRSKGTGILNSYGTLVVDWKLWSMIYKLNCGHFIFTRYGNNSTIWGVSTIQDEVLFELEGVDEISLLGDGYFLVSKRVQTTPTLLGYEDLFCGVMDDKEGYILNVEYTSIEYLGNDLFKVEGSGYSGYGLANAKSEMLLPMVYDDIKKLSDRHIAYLLGGEWGIYYTEDCVSTDLVFSSITNGSDRYVNVEYLGEKGIFDLEGMGLLTMENIVEVKPIFDFLAFLDTNRGWVIKDKELKPILDGYWQSPDIVGDLLYLNSNTEEISYIYNKLTSTWLRVDGLISRLKCFGFFSLRQGEGYKLIDYEGKIRCNKEYSSITHLKKVGEMEYFVVEEKDTLLKGVINSMGVEVLQPQYLTIFNTYMGGNLVICEAELNKYRIMSVESDNSIKDLFNLDLVSWSLMDSQRILLTLVDGGMFLADKTGRVLTKEYSSIVESPSGLYITVNEHGLTGVLYTDGSVILEPKYFDIVNINIDANTITVETIDRETKTFKYYV